MSVHSGPDNITNGLIVSLDSGNSRSYPGSGTTWYDMSGNGNNATLAGMEFVSDGKFLRNSGNTGNSYSVTVANSVTLSNMLTVTTGGWSVEEVFLTYDMQYPYTDAGFVGSTNGYQAGATGFDINHGGHYFRVEASSFDGNVTYADAPAASAGTATTNVWKHRIVVFDRTNNEVRLYLNGALDKTITTPNTAGRTIYDGGGIVFGTLYGWVHFGRRTVTKMYNKVLTAPEIKQNFNAIRGRFGI